MATIILTVMDNKIAPRFDLATEVLIFSSDPSGAASTRSMLLPGPSADDLCALILKEGIDVLICGGIEDEHYKFLSWKKIEVIDRIIGNATDVLERYTAGNLHEGDIVKGITRAKGGSPK